MTQIKQQSVAQFMKQFKESLFNFFQQTESIFPSEFLNQVHTILNPNQNNLQQQVFSIGKQLLEINQLSIYHMAQKINNLTQNDAQKSSASTVRQKSNTISIKDYQILEGAVQKAEQQIRKHIGIEHQMKICLQELEDELDGLNLDNEDLKKENNFLKKELSLTKKKQIEVLKSKIEYLEQRFRISKPNPKLHTEPEAMISHDNSHTSLKKSFDNLKEKQKSSKKQLITKSDGYSKLGSRKTSKLGLLSNQIDVNLHNFITLNTHIKKEAPTKMQGKETFWNKRLKKRESPVIHGEHSSIQQNAQNKSLNISPRQIRRQQKQKDLKEVYATNPKEFRSSYHPTIHEDTVTKKKLRRDYSNGETYQIKRSTLGKGLGVDRSRSVVY